MANRAYHAYIALAIPSEDWPEQSVGELRKALQLWRESFDIQPDMAAAPEISPFWERAKNLLERYDPELEARISSAKIKAQMGGSDGTKVT